jgi:putative transposase
MANTYGQNYQHFIFAPKYRRSAILDEFRIPLQQYISGIVRNRTCKSKLPDKPGDRHKMLAIYAMPDHIHMLIGMKPWESVSELVQVIKQESTNFINEHKFTKFPFAWQRGYGHFSHGHKEVDAVLQYILNQPEHHKKMTFAEEIKLILTRQGVAFEEKFLFQWIEDE